MKCCGRTAEAFVASSATSYFVVLLCLGCGKAERLSLRTYSNKEEAEEELRGARLGLLFVEALS